MGADQLIMAETLVIALPATPDAELVALHWWRVADGVVVESGVGDEWLGPVDPGDKGADLRVMALAPAESVMLHSASLKGAPPKQAASVARATAIEASLGDNATLHAVASVPTAVDQPVTVALVDNGKMLAWLDWLAARNRDPDIIYPAALLLTGGEHWRIGEIAGETIAARQDLAFPHDDTLAAALIGDEPVETVTPDEIDLSVAQAATTPLVNLRSGRFAKKRRWTVDYERLRELGLLLLVLPLVSLLIALVLLIKLDLDADRLDDLAAARASQVLGKQVPIESAEAELDARLSSIPGAAGGLSAPLAGLYSAVQAEPGITSSAIGWRNDGTLTVTLAGGRVEEINRLLIMLQRDGYRVTAVPQTSPDGRATADITIRATP